MAIVFKAGPTIYGETSLFKAASSSLK